MKTKTIVGACLALLVMSAVSTWSERVAAGSEDVDSVIERAYHDILDRGADPEGLRHYRRLMLDEGWSEQDVREDLRQSDEAHRVGREEDHGDRHRGIDPDDAVRRAYRDVLNRDPDPDGLQTYRRMIEKEGWSEDDVRSALKKSPEYRNRR